MVISMEFHGLSGGNQKGIDFPIRLGISSSQLMNSIIFQRGRYTTFYHQPEKGFNGLNREIFGFHLPVSSFFLGGNRLVSLKTIFRGLAAPIFMVRFVQFGVGHSIEPSTNEKTVDTVVVVIILLCLVPQVS